MMHQWVVRLCQNASDVKVVVPVDDNLMCFSCTDPIVKDFLMSSLPVSSM